MAAEMKRINIVVDEERHRRLIERGENVSALVRSLIGAHLEGDSIGLSDSHKRSLEERGVDPNQLIGDLISDYLASRVIRLQVSEETFGLYEKVMGMSGATDAEIEPHLIAVFNQVLADRIKALKELYLETSGGYPAPGD